MRVTAMPNWPSNDAATARSAGKSAGDGAVEGVRGVSVTGLGLGAGMNTGGRLGGGSGAETQAEMRLSEIRRAQQRAKFISNALKPSCVDITPQATNDATNDSETAVG